MAKLLYVTYVNQSVGTKASGKTYGRVKYTETLDTRDLAEHIAGHGSIYTIDVVLGVIEKMRTCIVEQLLDSKKVKLDGLGTFCLRSRSRGKAVGEIDPETEKPIAFTADDITSLMLGFTADQSERYEMTSRALRGRANLMAATKLVPNQQTNAASDQQGEGNGD